MTAQKEEEMRRLLTHMQKRMSDMEGKLGEEFKLGFHRAKQLQRQGALNLQ